MTWSISSGVNLGAVAMAVIAIIAAALAYLVDKKSKIRKSEVMADEPNKAAKPKKGRAK